MSSVQDSSPVGFMLSLASMSQNQRQRQRFDEERRLRRSATMRSPLLSKKERRGVTFLPLSVIAEMEETERIVAHW